MAHFAYSSEESKDLTALCYKDISIETLTDEVHSWFQQEGYTLKDGQPSNGSYTKGTRILRILLGAFYKYYAFDVNIRTYQEEVHLDVRRASIGMSGGMIGIKQMKNEMQRITAVLKLF